MRTDIEQIVQDFDSIRSDLENLASNLRLEIKEQLKELERVDKISARVKSTKSFKEKACKEEQDGKPKYAEPLKEIQDMIGLRIVVYYEDDFEQIMKIVEPYFNRVEKRRITPDDEAEFGYEGLHYIFFIPEHHLGPYRDKPIIPNFFELQIKTLFQHAWAQAGHGLGYKPKCEFTRDLKRKLAFVAAQSWGADQILTELFRKSKETLN